MGSVYAIPVRTTQQATEAPIAEDMGVPTEEAIMSIGEQEIIMVGIRDNKKK